jgi:type IV secretion system protein VirB9
MSSSIRMGRAAPGIGRAAFLACSLMYSIALMAESVPPKGSVDSRIRSAGYDGDEVYKLRGFIGYQIDLEFEAGETFVGLGAGDLEGVSFVGQDNHLFLKPKAAKVATNLTVLTSRRHYQFDYSASPRAPAADDADVIYALRFTYPPLAPSAADAAAKRLDAQLDGASAGRRQNIDYWYCGQPALKPVAASDDGIHTRLRFAANADLPALFVRNEDGSESLLNFSVDAGDLVVHRVARRFILRRGRLTGCILNKGFTGGVRLESGTVAPEVERRVQGGVP